MSTRIYGTQLDGARGRLLAGLVVLGLGILWTLDNLGVTDAGRVLDWWPVLVIGFGVVKIFGLGTGRSTFIGSIALAFGLLTLAGKLGYVHAGFGLIWPLLIIVMGFNLVRRAVIGPKRPGATTNGDDSSHVSAFAMMGATTRRAYSQQLVSADATAVAAGTELDLREAKPAGDSIVVDVFAMWGGIEIYVPVGWRVLVETTPIMGGVEDKTLPPDLAGPVPTVIIRGLVIMGGVEISHVPDKERGVRGVRVGYVAHVRGEEERNPAEPAGPGVYKAGRRVEFSGPGVHIRVEKGVIPVDPTPGPGAPRPAPGTPGDPPPPIQPS